MFIEIGKNLELWAIARLVGYSGKHLEAKPLDHTLTLHSYWSGGEKDDWTFIDLSSRKQIDIPQNGTAFDGQSYQVSELPNNICLACVHTGRYSDCTLYFRPDQIVALLPAPADITPDQKTVLEYTASLKNSYGGETNIRYREAHKKTGITPAQWEQAKAECTAKGWLNKAGAITPAGRNMRSTWTKY